jgi:hypothetical protein
MRDLARSTPTWIEAIGGDVISSAIVDVGHSDTDPSYPHEIFLEVEARRANELDDDSLPYLWRYGLAEQRDEDLGFGWAASLEDAQQDCWRKVIEYLTNEGFTNDQIVQSVGP